MILQAIDTFEPPIIGFAGIEPGNKLEGGGYDK